MSPSSKQIVVLAQTARQLAGDMALLQLLGEMLKSRYVLDEWYPQRKERDYIDLDMF